eukprot:1154236-Pelagomonas_calceolata.AAC.14
MCHGSSVQCLHHSLTTFTCCLVLFEGDRAVLWPQNRSQKLVCKSESFVQGGRLKSCSFHEANLGLMNRQKGLAKQHRKPQSSAERLLSAHLGLSQSHFNGTCEPLYILFLRKVWADSQALRRSMKKATTPLQCNMGQLGRDETHPDSAAPSSTLWQHCAIKHYNIKSALAALRHQVRSGSTAQSSTAPSSTAPSRALWQHYAIKHCTIKRALAALHHQVRSGSTAQSSTAPSSTAIPSALWQHCAIKHCTHSSACHGLDHQDLTLKCKLWQCMCAAHVLAGSLHITLLEVRTEGFPMNAKWCMEVPRLQVV